MSQNKINANASVHVNILTPHSIEKTSDLHFGSMGVSAGAGGTCVLATTGTSTQTGGVYFSQLASQKSNAAFNVTGAIGYTYAITLPASITVTETEVGAATMIISSLFAESSSNGIGLIGILNSSGEDSVLVGGTLNVEASQLDGIYAGTFIVTIAYN